MGSFSVWHWLIVLLIVVVIFGTKKLRNIGSDLGGAVKGFKDEVNRSIELEDLKKMKSQFEDAARNVEQSVSSELSQTAGDLQAAWQPPAEEPLPPNSGQHDGLTPVPQYRHPKKNWRLKRG